MIDPVIYTFHLGSYEFPLYWYGVIVMLGAVIGTWLAEKEITRRGENGESIWDALVVILPIGIIGARLWFVINATLGGNTFYMTKPLEILNIRAGGLHIFGGFLLGGIALISYLKKKRFDVWLFLDAIAPAVLLGQAAARPANFINQELYGPPTNLLWGIPISAEHRLPMFADLVKYPVETTRFHPTFAYEMILNVLIVLFLLWLSRRGTEENEFNPSDIVKVKPGTIFSAWLALAGLSRAFIELFRPDQPKIGDSFVSFSMLVSLLMSLTGVIMLLIRYGKIQTSFGESWEEEYVLSGSLPARVSENSIPSDEDLEDEDEPAEKPKKPRTTVKKKTTVKRKAPPRGKKTK